MLWWPRQKLVSAILFLLIRRFDSCGHFFSLKNNEKKKAYTLFVVGLKKIFFPNFFFPELFFLPIFFPLRIFSSSQVPGLNLISVMPLIFKLYFPVVSYINILFLSRVPLVWKKNIFFFRKDFTLNLAWLFVWSKNDPYSPDPAANVFFRPYGA